MRKHNHLPTLSYTKTDQDMTLSVQEYKPMKAKCSYADKYKAMRKPTCGCLECERKWKEKQKSS